MRGLRTDAPRVAAPSRAAMGPEQAWIQAAGLRRPRCWRAATGDAVSARYGRKLDENHRVITNMLALLGARTETIQGPPGTPDIIVRCFGVERVAEVKPPGEKLNANQVAWWKSWGRAPTVLRTPADCEVLVSEMRAELFIQPKESQP